MVWRTAGCEKNVAAVFPFKHQACTGTASAWPFLSPLRCAREHVARNSADALRRCLFVHPSLPTSILAPIPSSSMRSAMPSWRSWATASAWPGRGRCTRHVASVWRWAGALGGACSGVWSVMRVHEIDCLTRVAGSRAPQALLYGASS